MQLWYQLYVVAVFGSFVARLLWWLNCNEPKEVYRELRLGWWRYFLEDLTAGIATALRMVTDADGLSVQQAVVDRLLKQVAKEHGFDSFWLAPCEKQRTMREEAERRAVALDLNFEKFFEALEASKGAARRFAWAAGLWAAISVPTKALFVSVCAAADVPIDTVICLTGKLGDEQLTFNVWRQANGKPRYDAKVGFPGSEHWHPFVMIRDDDAAGARLGVGALWAPKIGGRVHATALFRGFSKGTRGSPWQIQAWPQLSYSVCDNLAFGGHCFIAKPSGEKVLVLYGPTVAWQLSKHTEIDAQGYFPGPSVEVDFVQAVVW